MTTLRRNCWRAALVFLLGFAKVTALQVVLHGASSLEPPSKSQDDCIPGGGWPSSATVHSFRDQNGHSRCFVIFDPQNITSGPVPVIVYFHGLGESAAFACSSDHNDHVLQAESLGYALVCANAVDRKWALPETESGCPCTNSQDPLACSADATPDYAYVEHILDTLHDAAEVYDKKRIFFTGFSQGAAFTGWAAFCFSEHIRGVAQSSTGLKLHGPAVTEGVCTIDRSGLCKPGVDDGIHTPNSDGECDSCEYFPSRPQQTMDVIGQQLRFCLYVGCEDFLRASVENMDQYLTDLDLPHSLEYRPGVHQVPEGFLTKVAACHGLISDSSVGTVLTQETVCNAL